MDSCNKKSNITEFGDRLNKQDIYNGVLLLALVGSFFGCAVVRGCQEIKAHYEKGKIPAVQTINNIQNVR